jgi:hypothetical protein
MKSMRLLGASTIIIGGFLGFLYGGCGYYENQFDEVANNTLGTCIPDVLKGGCQLEYKCDPANPWTEKAENRSRCYLSNDPDDKPSGKCDDGICKFACVVDNNCECSSNKPCGEVQCFTVTCDNNSCKYTPKIPTQDGEAIGCKLAGDTTDGYCNSLGNCVECYNDEQCGENRYCQNSRCFSTMQLGANCSEDAQCASGFCADGVCCNEKCDTTCKSCATKPFKGKCIDVPKGGRDDACDNGYGCVWEYNSPPKMICELGLVNGQKCEKHADCLSGRCIESSGNNKTCIQNNGACETDKQCFSGDCSIWHMCWPAKLPP